MQKKFRYKLVRNTGFNSNTDLEEFLNDEGEEGWELCCIDYGYMIFKQEYYEDY
jgi:hypothetical protein